MPNNMSRFLPRDPTLPILYIIFNREIKVPVLYFGGLTRWRGELLSFCLLFTWFFNFIYFKKINLLAIFFQHHRYLQTNKTSVNPTATSTKPKSPIPAARGNEKSNETKNALAGKLQQSARDKEKPSENKNAPTAKPLQSGEKNKTAAKKTVKTTETKKPASTNAASKGTNTPDGGQKKTVQLSTGWVQFFKNFSSASMVNPNVLIRWQPEKLFGAMVLKWRHVEPKKILALFT